jgi:hypothetical protein
VYVHGCVHVPTANCSAWREGKAFFTLLCLWLHGANRLRSRQARRILDYLASAWQGHCLGNYTFVLLKAKNKRGHFMPVGSYLIVCSLSLS